MPSMSEAGEVIAIVPVKAPEKRVRSPSLCENCTMTSPAYTIQLQAKPLTLTRLSSHVNASARNNQMDPYQ